MNKYTLYQEAYGNDKYWCEGYVNVETNEYITLIEYEERVNKEDMSFFKLVYPESEIKKNRNVRSKLPDFQEILIGSASDAQAALLGRSCGYDTFREKLLIEDTVFTELYCQCNLANSTYLAELFVRSDQQGRGWGYHLLTEYIASCKKAGTQGILTRTTSLKRNPQKMFLDQGFEEVFDYGPTDPWKRKLFYLLLTP